MLHDVRVHRRLRLDRYARHVAEEEGLPRVTVEGDVRQGGGRKNGERREKWGGGRGKRGHRAGIARDGLSRQRGVGVVAQWGGHGGWGSWGRGPSRR